MSIRFLIIVKDIVVYPFFFVYNIDGDRNSPFLFSFTKMKISLGALPRAIVGWLSFGKPCGRLPDVLQRPNQTTPEAVARHHHLHHYTDYDDQPSNNIYSTLHCAQLGRGNENTTTVLFVNKHMSHSLERWLILHPFIFSIISRFIIQHKALIYI